MKKLLYILFHRSVFVCLALLAQFATLVIMVVVFSEYTESFYWCCILISILAALAIICSRMEPGYKIAWLILILPFPVFGGIFYLLVGGGTIPRRTQKRMQGKNPPLPYKMTLSPTTLSPLAATPPARPTIWSNTPPVPPTRIQKQNTSLWGTRPFRVCWRSWKRRSTIFFWNTSLYSPVFFGTASWPSWNEKRPRALKCV